MRLTAQRMRRAAVGTLTLPSLPLCLLLCTLWLVACVHGMTDETIADLRYIHSCFLIGLTDLAD